MGSCASVCTLHLTGFLRGQLERPSSFKTRGMGGWNGFGMASAMGQWFTGMATAQLNHRNDETAYETNHESQIDRAYLLDRRGRTRRRYLHSWA